jgi:alpha-1,2-mannosyltransferase
MGPRFNWQCLMSWRQNIISPFVEGDTIPSVQEVNQSMPGVLTRLLTAPKVKGEHGNGHIDGDLQGLNLVSMDPEHVALIAKGLALGFVALLAWLCRTRTTRRDDPRFLGEFALVVLTMLFVSERSWKHHYVTILLPYTYLVYQTVAAPVSRRVRLILGGSLIFSALLMASSSSDLSDLIAGEGTPEVALYYGMFLWSALVLYLATAWRVLREGRKPTAWDEPPLPAPHLGRAPSATTPGNGLANQGAGRSPIR